jgi:hypothetical protein
MKDQKGSVNVWPEKLYTQREVDDLLEEKGDSRPSLASKVEQETQTANKQKRQDDRTVAGLVKRSNRILASISSIFPFDIFPNIINAEDGRITIIQRHLLSSVVHSVDIKDISNVFINTAFFFSQLVIISNTFEDNEIRIKFLRPKEAILIRRIIEGLRVFERKQIDTSTYTKEELISKLEELSTTTIVM